MDIGLFIVRLVVGLVFAAHGAQKLFGWWGGHGLAATSGMFEKMGFRPGKLHATLAAGGEFFGGLALAAGLATPAAAAVVVAIMIVAASAVHFKNGLFLPTGFEYNLVLGGTALGIAFTGAGSLSVDALLGFNAAGWGYGLAALAAGIAGALGSLVTRSTPAVPQASKEAS